MAEEPEKSGQEPNLELPPLLGFGRKKKRRPEPTATEAAAADAPATEDLPEAPGGDSEPLASDPVPPLDTRPRGRLAPATGTAKRLPPVPPPAEPVAVTEPVEVFERDVEAEEDPDLTEPARGDVDTSTRPGSEPRPASWSSHVTEPWTDPDAESATEPTQVLPRTPIAPPPPAPEAATAPPVEPAPVRPTPVQPAPVEHAAPPPPPPPDEPAAVVAEPAAPPRAAPRPDFVPPPRPPQPEAELEAQPETEPEEPPSAPRSRSLTLPALSPRIAVVVTGAVAGLSGVLLAYVAAGGCEAVRGVGSCGGLGLVALLVITAIEIVLGAVLLTAFRLSDATSTSFLGVGLAAVFVLLFLLGRLESVWMLLVIPVLTALTFLLSLWVSTTFVDVPETSEPLR